jgi:hypothetical protein
MFKRDEEGIFGQNQRLYLRPNFRREPVPAHLCSDDCADACDDMLEFLYGNRNRDGSIVLKYPVMNLLQPLRWPGVYADQPASNPIPYGK